MKRLVLLIGIILFFFGSSLAQINIDENVSIEIPGSDIHKRDTVIENISVRTYSLKNSTESYLVARTEVLSNKNEKDDSPQNINDLRAIYHSMLNRQINALAKQGFVFSSSKEICDKDYIVYKVRYNKANSANLGAESILLYLNRTCYNFIYSGVNKFSKKNSDQFLNSLSIHNSPKQIIGSETNAFFSSFLESIFYFFILVALIIGFIKRKKHYNSKWGMNLKTLYCPVCKTEQRKVRVPKNIRQVLWGGCTCPNCNTEMDKFGNIIN